jgi:6-phosphogluconolactonase
MHRLRSLRFLCLPLTIGWIASGVPALLPPSSATAAEQVLYIASGTKTEGISSCRFDLETGAFTKPTPAVAAASTGFLALHPSQPWLYSLTEGDVHAFRRLPAEGKLQRLNVEPSGDTGATHLEVGPRGQRVAVAHYGGGSTSLLPIADGGKIKPVSTVRQHAGKSVHPQRQQKPFAHGVAFDPSGRFLCVADLGTDHVELYRINDVGELETADRWQAAPGAGPRHLTFHPNGRFLYAINELDSTLSALRFDAAAGTLTEIQTIRTLPSDFTAANTTAEVVVHPSGKFLYGSNRGHDSTAVFRIDQETGQLQWVEAEPTLGGHPRFVVMDPTGQYYLAANRDADNLVSFRIDQETGELTATGHEEKVARPM